MNVLGELFTVSFVSKKRCVGVTTSTEYLNPNLGFDCFTCKEPGLCHWCFLSTYCTYSEKHKAQIDRLFASETDKTLEPNEPNL